MWTYSKRHPISVNAKCMVFVDQKTPAYSGGRTIKGIIRDKFNRIITIEITETTFDSYKKGEQLWFNDFQVWPLGQDVKQLNLFA